jgi:DNA polymerase-1
LIDADYSQIELRLLAHISNDENMIRAFRNNEDIHARTASEVFGVPLNEVTSLQRSRAKAVNFGIVYGISDFGLSRNLNISRSDAKAYIEKYLDSFPGVKKYMNDIVETVRETGFAQTMFGRRRYLPISTPRILRSEVLGNVQH